MNLHNKNFHKNLGVIMTCLHAQGFINNEIKPFTTFLAFVLHHTVLLIF